MLKTADAKQLRLSPRCCHFRHSLACQQGRAVGSILGFEEIQVNAIRRANPGRAVLPGWLLEKAVHHQGVHVAKLGMQEGFGQAADNFEATALP